MPIQSHSKESSELMIFSVFNDILGHNNERHAKAIELLQFSDIWHKELEGCYKGIREKSILINRGNSGVGMDLSIKAKQKSILLIGKTGGHGTRKARIFFLDGAKDKPLGYLRSVNKQIALEHDNYIYDAIANTYYITVEGYEEAISMY